MTQPNFSKHVSARKSGENAWLWLVKVITGLLVIIVLLIHFIVNHFVGETGLLTYADVVAYFQNPIVPIMEICFLVVVVTHSLIGLRSIILDLRPSRGLLKVIDWMLVIVGVFAISYGVWLALTIVSIGS